MRGRANGKSVVMAGLSVVSVEPAIKLYAITTARPHAKAGAIVGHKGLTRHWLITVVFTVHQKSIRRFLHDIYRIPRCTQNALVNE